jgi:hypothetical protein
MKKEDKCAICKKKFKKDDRVFKKIFDDEGMEYKKQPIICEKCFKKVQK